MKHVRHTIAKLLATAGVACLAAQPAYAASSWLSTVTTIENGARTTYSAGELSSRPLPRATSTTAVFDLVPLGDVSREATASALVDLATERFGGLDVMCANAGIFPQVTLAEMSPEDWDQVMAANLRRPFLCFKAVLPIFAGKPGGRVVLTSSITGPGPHSVTKLS